MRENSELIKKKMAQAIASGKLLKTAQFLLIVGLLVVVIVIGALNLFGVHLSASTEPIVNATQTHVPILP
jgi:hypothetical protein